MSGLNVEVDRILEIACIITDGKLTKSVEVFPFQYCNVYTWDFITFITRFFLFGVTMSCLFKIYPSFCRCHLLLDILQHLLFLIHCKIKE